MPTKKQISRPLKRKSSPPLSPKSVAAAAANRDRFFVTKKHRSDLPRRRRTVISPLAILHGFSGPTLLDRQPPGPIVSSSLGSSLNSNYDEQSCNTTQGSPSAFGLSAIDSSADRKLQQLKKKRSKQVSWSLSGINDAEVSGSSCVESSSIACEAESRPLPPPPQPSEIAEFEISALSGVVSSPEHAESYECDGQISSVVTRKSLLEAVAPNSTSTIEKKSDATRRHESGDSAFVCLEFLSDDDISSASTFCEVRTDIFADDSGEIDFFSEDYTPSIWIDDYSGSQFSEMTYGEEPSPGFSLFKHFSEQFVRHSSYSTADRFSAKVDEEISSDLRFWRFEDEEDEQSYRRLRIRERRGGLKLRDYAEMYASTAEYADLLVKQRLRMVEWILQASNAKELHDETRFLAVRLLDRFLSEGYFRSRLKLELVGIACLTLAIRIEENQPCNCILQKMFHVEENAYSRAEVVAMEWLVQEVLKFQCLSPTAYNFLWCYLKAARADEDMVVKARVLAELAMLDHRQAQFWPSSLAAGIVILACLAAKSDESCQIVMEAHLRTTIDDLPECIKYLERLVPYAL